MLTPLPTRVRLRRDNPLPRLARPRMDACAPTATQLRTLQVDPSVIKSQTVSRRPKWHRFRMLTELPNKQCAVTEVPRRKPATSRFCLMLTELLIANAPATDACPYNALFPEIESPLLLWAAHRRLMLLPKWTKPVTEI
jgi:hypothetical protein